MELELFCLRLWSAGDNRRRCDWDRLAGRFWCGGGDRRRGWRRCAARRLPHRRWNTNRRSTCIREDRLGRRCFRRRVSRWPFSFLLLVSLRGVARCLARHAHRALEIGDGSSRTYRAAFRLLFEAADEICDALSRSLVGQGPAMSAVVRQAGRVRPHLHSHLWYFCVVDEAMIAVDVASYMKLLERKSD